MKIETYMQTVETFHTALNTMTNVFSEDVAENGEDAAVARFKNMLLEHDRQTRKQRERDRNAEVAYMIWYAAASVLTAAINVGVWHD